MKIAGQVTSSEEADVLEYIVKVSVLGIRMRQVAAHLHGEHSDIDEDTIEVLLK